MRYGLDAISNFVVFYVQIVDSATSYLLEKHTTMVPAIRRIFVWKKFVRANSFAKCLLTLVFTFFIAGLICVVLTHGVKF